MEPEQIQEASTLASDPRPLLFIDHRLHQYSMKPTTLCDLHTMAIYALWWEHCVVIWCACVDRRAFGILWHGLHGLHPAPHAGARGMGDKAKFLHCRQHHGYISIEFNTALCETFDSMFLG